MHTIKDKAKLIGRVRRIKGQVEALERALEAELGCGDVLMLVGVEHDERAARTAMNAPGEPPFSDARSGLAKERCSVA